ncbi:MAG: hypothetical protein LC676_18310 [Loktanella sp.]|nr:hypothetical protein [Loktanella sp.]
MTFNFDSETNYHAFLDQLVDLDIEFIDRIENLSVDVPVGDAGELEELAEACGGWMVE